MRAIASSFFETSPLMAGPQIAMLIFFAIFAVVVLRVVRSRAADFDDASRLPLEGEEQSRREDAHE